MARGPVEAGLSAICGTAVALALATTAATAAQETFPYNQEMLLEARPLPGGKRVPIIEVMRDGRAQIDLWCRSAPALVTVVGNSIVITLGPMADAQCTQRRAQADAATAQALSQVTHWRVENNQLVLIGPTTLRFRPSLH